MNPFTDFGFKRLFGEEARISAFTDEEKAAYEDSLKVLRDNQNIVDTAHSEGRTERERASR